MQFEHQIAERITRSQIITVSQEWQTYFEFVKIEQNVDKKWHEITFGFFLKNDYDSTTIFS